MNNPDKQLCNQHQIAAGVLLSKENNPPSCETKQFNPFRRNTHHIDDERQEQQKQPDVQVDRIAEHILVHVVEPPAGQTGQHSLSQDFQGLRPHCRRFIS